MVQRACRDAIQIRQIASANDTQAVQVEVRIAQLERIKSPLNQPYPAAQSLLALEQFQHAAYAAVAVIGLHAGHVGMEVGHAIAKSDHCQGIAHQTAAIEHAEHLAAAVGRDDEHRGGFHFQVRFAPDFTLEVHTLMKLLELLAFADNDFRTHRLVRAPLMAFPSDFAPILLVESHSASISSRGRSWNSWPPSRARCSIARKRRENFALAFFKAISGSTFKNRERFTAAKSKSPSSSSISRPSENFKAFLNSSVSSAIFSNTPPVSSQSKPTRAALRVS